MNTLAEQYVKLVLAVGQHDADYVDAFYGAPEWRASAEVNKTSLAAIDEQAAAYISSVSRVEKALRARPTAPDTDNNRRTPQPRSISSTR